MRQSDCREIEDTSRCRAVRGRRVTERMRGEGRSPPATVSAVPRTVADERAAREALHAHELTSLRASADLRASLCSATPPHRPARKFRRARSVAAWMRLSLAASVAARRAAVRSCLAEAAASKRRWQRSSRRSPEVLPGSRRRRRPSPTPPPCSGMDMAAASGWGLKVRRARRRRRADAPRRPAVRIVAGRLAHIFYRWHGEPLSVYVLNHRFDHSANACARSRRQPARRACDRLDGARPDLRGHRRPSAAGSATRRHLRAALNRVRP